MRAHPAAHDRPSTNPSSRSPAAPQDPRDHPASITFFLTAAQRERVLNALRLHGRRRATALLRALGLDHRR